MCESTILALPMAPLLGDKPVLDNSNLFDFKFHDRSHLREPALFQPAARRRRTRADDLRGVDRLVARKVRDDGIPLVIHAAGIAAAPLDAIDAGNHRKVM